ncbi:MAG TPA: PfkB family carbohydrate kinase [Flavobacteriaceae bacterium]|nr:bifunctional hydroxymethylpyrimidine kinase/phosphomethylpyrimidine kinase [Flavobacteriaceae bacterium]MCB9212011.1 bifunctional hydroxymethylpyrimidine kinase/phosphomethylpyrimidine kinase [Alteromonas sp.]HPF09895.1 PfkB family carbohydrate kinase [Flavobacteriaceae bacterium]HQU19992.1 PfkB family carbohydrate kinase [Flavobacteriaceae bacterium]HQU64022.1 PfkB family carbohydrate kinase [Flavobacteriaceae bacterium]
MSKLVIVGSVAFDAIETPFGKTDKILGGAATYIGLAASQFGVDSAIVSIVGGDFPTEYLDMLKIRGIDLSALEVVKDGKTFFWSGKYHNDMNSRDTLTTELNVLADFEPVIPEHYRDAAVVMLGNLHPLVQLSVIEQMKAPKMIVLDTMNFWMNHTWDELMQVISKVNVMTINDEEARQLTKEYSLVVAAQKIMKMGPEFVVIKKGEHGALLFHKEDIFFAPALPLEEVFDPTGAGDTFAGGFTGYLTKTGDFSFENMKSAIINGSALASFCVEKFGAEKLLELNREALQRRLQQFKNLTQFNIELVSNMP